MQPGTLSKALKSGAIWGFIVLELIFFSVAGEFLSLSDKAFMDWENMLLLLKQSAPIGIIAMGSAAALPWTISISSFAWASCETSRNIRV